MVRNWKRALSLSLVALFSVIIVADVQGGIFFRRRSRGNRNYTTYNYGTTGMTYGAGTYGASTSAGVGVAPGVNTGVLGTRAGVRARANVPGVGNAGAGTNINVRGQTPDANVNVGAGANATAPVAPAVPAAPAPIP